MKVSDEHFSEAVNDLIASERAAPMIDQISRALDVVKVRQQQRSIRGYGSMLGELENAAKRNTKVDTDFVKTCVTLVKEKIMGKLTKEQFSQGCDLIDQAAKVFRG